MKKKQGYITVQTMFGGDEIAWREDNNHPTIYGNLLEAESTVEEDYQDLLNNNSDTTEDEKDYVAYVIWESPVYRVEDLDKNFLFFYNPEKEKYIY